MLDTSELFKANFRNMESLKKINILNDLSKVNFGFKETTNGINEAFKKINILNDLSKINFRKIIEYINLFEGFIDSVCGFFKSKINFRKIIVVHINPF